MKIRFGAALLGAAVFCFAIGTLWAQEKYLGPGFPLRPFEFLSSYRTFDAEVAEVKYYPVKTLKHGDRLVAYRRILIHVKTNSKNPWKKEFTLTGWMVGGYFQTMEWKDSCEEREMSLTVTFSPVRPADMNSVGKLILLESGDKESVPVWFWKGDSSSPW